MDEQFRALMQLGLELKAANWTPSTPLATSFDDDPQRPPYEVRLAISFLRNFDTKIRGIICKNGRCRVEIQTASTISSTVLDYLLQIKDIPIPANTVANCLILYGLEKFCSEDPPFKFQPVQPQPHQS